MARDTTPVNWFAPFCPVPAESEAALFAGLRQQFGAGAVARLRQAMEDRRTGGGAAFYDALDCPELYTALSLAYDGDSLPKIAAFLAGHRALLRGRVLDLGCGCGLLTLAAGRMAQPEVLVAVDRSAVALAAARQVCEQGSVPARFAPAMPAEEFDAVLSLRTLHENFDQSGVPRWESLLEAGRRLAARMAGHARALTAPLAADGVLLSVERCGAGPVLLGWLLALARCGFVVADCAALEARECGRAAFFQALVLRRGTADETAVLMQFCACTAPPEPVSVLSGAAAEAYLLRWSGTPCCCFAVCAPDGTPMGRGGVWRHRTDGRALAFQGSPAGSCLRVLPPEQCGAAEAQLRASARQAQSAGYMVQFL